MKALMVGIGLVVSFVIHPALGVLVLISLLLVWVGGKGGASINALRLPVYASHKEAPEGVLYKVKRDEDYIAHFKTSGAGLIVVSYNLRVAGISKYQDVARKFLTGQNQRLLIQREPDNQYDKNALMVIGVWSEDGSERNAKLGYVAKEEARDIAKRFPNAALFGMLDRAFLPLRDLSAGFEFSIAVKEEELPETSKRKSSKSIA